MNTLTPLFQGRTRVVYAMQDRPGLVLKLESPERARKIDTRKGWLYALKRRSVSARFSYIKREYDTYVRAMLRAARVGRVPPLPRPRGLVLTEAGLGEVISMVRDIDGNPAPTLRRAIADGATPELLEQLNILIEDIRSFAIPVHDLSPDNIVWETRKNRRRFVLVDGFGDKTWIPVGRYFRSLNERRLSRQCTETAEAIGLTFDSNTFRFTMA